jgi:hypothetical protein
MSDALDDINALSGSRADNERHAIARAALLNLLLNDDAVHCFVVSAASLGASTLFIEVLLCAVDPRLTIHHSCRQGKSMEISEERPTLSLW